MIRNLKMFGRAIVAVFAISAVAASMASADSFTAESAPVTWTGNQQTANVFTTTVGTVKCSSTTLKGTVTIVITIHVTLTPGHSGCTAFGFPADIDVNGCTYQLNISPTAGVTTGTADIVCPAGQEMTVTATTSSTNPTLKCNGSYAGSVLVTGENAGGTHVGIFLS